MSDAVVTTRIDSEMKKQAMEIADALGMPLSVVIKAFLKQFIRTRSVYFSAELEEPTAYLLNSLRQSQDDKKAGRVTSFNTGEEALDYLDAEIANDKQNK
jgi:DNA-damage-inducible protein J